MNIVYIHGYKSAFSRENGKVEYLELLGDVTGPNIDYSRPVDEIIMEVTNYVISSQADLIVGTSLGGWVAAEVAHRTGVLFVALNPSIEPTKTLGLEGYDPMSLKGAGLVMVDKGDEVLDADRTLAYVTDEKPTVAYEGGNHRFAHMEEALDVIRQFANINGHVLGFA